MTDKEKYIEEQLNSLSYILLRTHTEAGIKHILRPALIGIMDKANEFKPVETCRNCDAKVVFQSNGVYCPICYSHQ